MNRLRSIVLIILVLILTNCTEKIDVELDNTYERIVIEGSITTDTCRQAIKIFRSTDFLNTKRPAGISGAEVIISDGTDQYVLTENDTAPGVYETDPDFYGVPGRTYQLLVRNIDFDKDGQDEEYTASSMLNPVTYMDSIRVEYEDIWGGGWWIRLYALDPAETKDFYVFRVYKNNILLTDTLTEVGYADDVIFNGGYTYGIELDFLQEAHKDEVVKIGDTITVEMGGITEEYYKFIEEVYMETTYNSPMFSGPRANVKSNISNGALGFFTAYSVTRCSVVYKGEIRESIYY